MKLDDLHTDIIWEGEIEGEELALYAELDEGHANINFGNMKGGVLHKVGGEALKLFNNPVAAGIAAGLALNALAKYKSNKNKTARFFAKDYRQKKFYKKIVNDLMKTGNYKKVTSKYVAGGYLWELQIKNLY